MSRTAGLLLSSLLLVPTLPGASLALASIKLSISITHPSAPFTPCCADEVGAWNQEKSRKELEKKLGAQKAKEEAERKIREEKERKKKEESRRNRAKDARYGTTVG